ncbi:ferrochelatase-2, chloroplastic-like isoform X2 [Hibiscus syriacus]|uniref:ferrochelatase-2, chloroplastic-like isoform X2 n=1 Tax=Hibiscus syriacus TaxID=106335 RepID=UPI001923F409|nr:ferrochelatase-2, chloroplastic-like isoform X2 [Hibiscus syriacus]
MRSGRIQSSASCSASSSSTFPHPPCLTSASRRCKFPRLLSPRALSLSQRVSGNCLVPETTQFSFSKQSNIIINKKHLFHEGVGALETSNTQAVSTGPLIGEEKIGVLLLNLGGPETLDDVQPFLFNLFADPDIIRLPRLFRFLQRPLAKFISVLRAPKSKEGCASIGGGSPLRRITDAQAEELRNSLWEKNVPAKVYVGMRYWHPFTEEAIEQVVIFFSAHGVPLAYVEEAGDPYKAETEECVDLIMGELEKRKIINANTLAYQSWACGMVEALH